MLLRFLTPFFLLLASSLTFSCKNLPNTIDEENSTVLVQMFNDESVPFLEEEFAKYDLLVEKPVSRPTYIYLFKFNSGKIIDSTLIKLLKKSGLVKEAQQNRNVQIRN